MKRNQYTCLTLFIFIVLLTSCHPFEFRKIDWKKQWSKNQDKLKNLTEDILLHGNKKYNIGNNSFPSGFKYPFDQGFYISGRFYKNRQLDTLNVENLMITYYMDRGLLDHYSAIVYTNDSISIEWLDNKVEQGGNDFKLESNWYVVND